MKKENLIGQKFYRLLVIEEVPPKGKNKRPSWKCMCDCGNLTPIIAYRGTNLKSGNTKSCGCLKSESSTKNCSKIGLSRRKYKPIISSAKCVFLAKYNDGDLTFEDFYEQSQMNCYYCNKKPLNINNTLGSNNRSEYYIQNCKFTYNGLDRIDNNFPHNKKNCVPCCKECNFSKINMPLQQFLNMITNIYNNRSNTIPDYNKLFTTNNKDYSQFSRIKGQLHSRYKDIDFNQNLFYFILTLNCFYCGSSNLNKTKCKNGDIVSHNGLDRLDQSKPHTLDNIVTCCKYCNWSKQKRSSKEFFNWATKIYNNLFF